MCIRDRYENAFADMGEREKVLPKDGKPSEYIKAYHKMFVSLYDDVLGDGCGVKIVGEKANARICNEAYESFLEFVAKQKASTMEQQNNLINKFSPNRAQDVYKRQIQNITQVFNNEQKFPEMDAYCISRLYADWLVTGRIPDSVVLTINNILTVFDSLMERMTENRVPMACLLYTSIKSSFP